MAISCYIFMMIMMISMMKTMKMMMISTNQNVEIVIQLHLGHIILIPSEPVFVIMPLTMSAKREAAIAICIELNLSDDRDRNTSSLAIILYHSNSQNKRKGKYITCSEQFKTRIAKLQKTSKSIQLTHNYIQGRIQRGWAGRVPPLKFAKHMLYNVN